MALTEVNSLGIKDLEVKTADIAAANVTLAKVENVTDGRIIVGNGSNRPTAVAVSGDVTLANTGAVTIANGAVEHAMLADDSVDGDNIADNSVGLAAMSGVARGAIITGDSSGDPKYLSVGSDNQVLTVDSNGDIGWEAASGGATINNATENEIVTVASTTSQLDAEAKFTYDGNTAILQTTSDGNALNVVRNSADANPVNITLTKSRNATYGSFTKVNNADQIGEIVWKADDGNDYASEAGAIRVDADGLTGGNDIPARMEFFTGADGSATAAKRLTLQSSGNLYVEDGDITFASGHGIDFQLTADAPGTSASSSSELFANYEKGSWTPLMSSGTVSASNAIYIRTGDLVWCQAQLDSISERSSDTELRITPASLPFAMDGGMVAAGAVRHRYTAHHTGSSGGEGLIAVLDGNGVYFTSNNDSGPSSGGAYSSLHYDEIEAAHSQIMVSIHYRTNSA